MGQGAGIQVLHTRRAVADPRPPEQRALMIVNQAGATVAELFSALKYLQQGSKTRS